MNPTHQLPPRPWRVRQWPALPLAFVGLGLALLALPARLEGPPVLPISTGHALSWVDALGVLPLTAGAVGLQAGLWRRRWRLAPWAAARPGEAAAVWFGVGVGLGLLLASVFSRFFWWWAVGAMIFAGSAGVLLAVVVRRRPEDGGRADERPDDA
jgi:hypothetical protein